MLLLALTTSTDQGSLALLGGNKILGKTNWTKKAQASEVLTLHVQKLLKNAKRSPQDLTGIAVDVGPGSFTGCRMAVNVARTMGYTLDIPIFTAASLDIMAFGARKHRGKIVCVLDAHKSLFYCQWYESDGSRIVGRGPAIKALPLKEVTALLSPKVLVIGEVPQGIKDFKVKSWAPQATDLALMSVDQGTEKKFMRWVQVEPSYVRITL